MALTDEVVLPLENAAQSRSGFAPGESVTMPLKAVRGALRWRPEGGVGGAPSPCEKTCGCLALAALILAQLTPSPHGRGGNVTEPRKASAHLSHEPYIKVFRGPHVPKKLSKIIVREPFHWRQSAERIGAVAAGTKIVDLLAGALTFEWEGLYGDHWGTVGFHEAGAAVYARWNWFPWNGYIRTTFAVGMGPSMTTRPAPYEPKGGTRSRWLMQMNFEINLYSPSNPQWALLLRIQHRSGVYGLINDVSGGSNFLTIGLRKNF